LEIIKDKIGFQSAKEEFKPRITRFSKRFLYSEFQSAKEEFNFPPLRWAWRKKERQGI